MPSKPLIAHSQLHLQDKGDESSTIQVIADTFVKTKTNNKDLDNTINFMIETIGKGKYACKVCGKVEPTRYITSMKIRIEGKHVEDHSGLGIHWQTICL